MVGDLGNFVGRDLGSQFMSKPQRLAEGDVVEEAEVELEEVTYTRADGSTVTYQYNPLTHEKPGMDGRMLKKGIDFDAVATEGGLGDFYETATAVETPADAPAAGPARPQQRRRPIPINPETDADEAERQADRDQMFNPITAIGKEMSVDEIDARNRMHQLAGKALSNKLNIPFQPRGPLEQYLTTGIDPYVRNKSGFIINENDPSRKFSEAPSLIRDNRMEGLNLPDELVKPALDYALGITGGPDRKEISPEDLTRSDIAELKELAELDREDRNVGLTGTEQIIAADASRRGEGLTPQEAATIEAERKAQGLLPPTSDRRSTAKPYVPFDRKRDNFFELPRAFPDRSGERVKRPYTEAEIAYAKDNNLSHEAARNKLLLEQIPRTDGGGEGGGEGGDEKPVTKEPEFTTYEDVPNFFKEPVGTRRGTQALTDPSQAHTVTGGLSTLYNNEDLNIIDQGTGISTPSVTADPITKPSTNVVLPSATRANIPSIEKIAESISRREEMPGNLTRLGLEKQGASPLNLDIKPIVSPPFTLPETDGPQPKSGQPVSKPDIDTGFPLGGGRTRADDYGLGRGARPDPTPKTGLEKYIDQHIEGGKKFGEDVISTGKDIAGSVTDKYNNLMRTISESLQDRVRSAGDDRGKTTLAEELISGRPESLDPTLPGPLSLTREDEIAKEADRRDRPGPFDGWGGQQVDAWNKTVADAKQGLRSLLSPVSEALQRRLLASAQGVSDDIITDGGPSAAQDLSFEYQNVRPAITGAAERAYLGQESRPDYGNLTSYADVYGAETGAEKSALLDEHMGFWGDDFIDAAEQISFAQDLADEGYGGWMMNRGGPVRFAQGGGLESVADQYLEPGSYVLSADVMSGLGNGSSAAGFETLSGLLGIPMPGTETSVNAYSGGPMLGKIEGPGDGTSDSVHTVIQSSDGKSGQQAARVAREEGVLTPEALKEVDRRFGTGKGDLGNAHNMMNNMMANVRKVKSGGSQPKDIIGQRQDPLKGLLGLFQKA